MKKNIIFISFFIVAIIALYFTKIFYSDHSLKKSIQACTIAQIKKSEENGSFCFTAIPVLTEAYLER